MNITHWVPADSEPHWPCVSSWMNLELPKGTKRTFVRSNSGNAKELYEWNEVVEQFLERGDEWLFSTHNDVVFDPKTLKRLLSWEKPIVSALIFTRQSPPVPHIWKTYEDKNRAIARIRDTREWFMAHPDYIKGGTWLMNPRPKEALVEVDFTSTACILIHRSVLEKTEKPWFEMWSNRGGGEDARFFLKAFRAGFRGYVDRSCVAGHLVGDIPVSSMDFIMWSQASEYVDTGEPPK